MYRTVSWTLWERARAGWFWRMALKYVYYHMWNGFPVQVWCIIQGAWAWCTGMTQRGGMGREVGGRFRMGNTCTPVADSCQCMAKPIQYCKVINLQKKKKNSRHDDSIHERDFWALNVFSFLFYVYELNRYVWFMKVHQNIYAMYFSCYIYFNKNGKKILTLVPGNFFPKIFLFVSVEFLALWQVNKWKTSSYFIW